MTFLNPLVLLGLVAAAIPLIIHLFNFRRPRRVDFSSLTFVRELQRSTMQRVRLKEWLLLLLRTLAIAALVLAFARPTATGGLAGLLGGRGSSAIGIVLDNSRSMELRDASGSYIDQARALARAIASDMESGDVLFLATTSEPSSAIDRFSSGVAASEAIETIEVSSVARPIRGIVSDVAARLADTEHVNREIYVVSDLQRSALEDSVELSLPSDVRVVLAPIGDRDHGNISIEDVQVETRIVEAGSPVRLEAAIRAYGGAPAEAYAVGLYLGDDRVAQAPVEVRTDVGSPVSLVVTPQQTGWLAGRVEGEDDGFLSDNTFFFTLHVPQRRRILLVSRTAGDVRYLRLALSAGDDAGESLFVVDAIQSSAFPNAISRIAEYDAIAFVGASPASGGERNAVREYVENGGGLLLAPGSASDPTELNPILEVLGGGSIQDVAGTPGAEQAISRFDQIDADHAVFAGVFEQRPGGESVVESPLVRAVAVYRPASGRERSLIRLENGSTFLQEIPHGRGTVMVMTVAPDERWSDLPTRGIFVPLVYRTIQYLSSTEAVQGEALVAGREAELRLQGVLPGEQVRITSPLGEEWIPEQRIVPGAVLVQLGGEYRIPGIYDVHADARLIRRVAVNVDRAESDLAQMDADELSRTLAQQTRAMVRVMDLSNGEHQDLASAVSAQRTGVELWNVFLIIALLFLVAEMIVARQWRPEAVAT